MSLMTSLPPQSSMWFISWLKRYFARSQVICHLVVIVRSFLSLYSATALPPGNSLYECLDPRPQPPDIAQHVVPVEIEHRDPFGLKLIRYHGGVHRMVVAEHDLLKNYPVDIGFP